MFNPILNEVNRKKVVYNIEEGLKKSEDHTDVHLILYTDGGCDNGGDKIGGWGIHGYWFTNKPTTSNSGCKGFVPTTGGYTKSKLKPNQSKANVLAYVDFFSGLTAPTTSNVAELIAMTNAIELGLVYPVKSVTILSDSEYVIKSLTQYIKGWIKRGWVNSTNKPVANKELWIDILESERKLREQLPKPSDLVILKIKGHSGDKGNDTADELATAGAWAIRNRPDIDSANFIVSGVDDYWGANSFHALFTETRLMFNPKLVNDVDNLYYQTNLPYTGTENKKEQVLCKRVTDLLLSVVKLDEPEPVIEGLQNYVVNQREYTGVFKTRLDSMKNVDNYQHLEKYPDGRYLIFNDELQTVTLPNKVGIFNVINKARLSFKVFSEFDYIKEVMYAIEGKVSGYDLVAIDINDYFYDEVPKGKSGDILINKMKTDIVDSISVPVSIPGYPVYDLVLTFGVDIPSKLGFNKFKTLNPEIKLFINLSGSSYFNYFVHVKVDGGCGLWCAPYSNEILLPNL